MPKKFREAVATALILLGSVPTAFSAEPAGGFSSLSWTGGGFVAVAPKYEGSKSYQIVGAPYIYPSFGGVGSNIAIRGADDIRFRLLESNGFVAGPLGGYKFGREEDDGSKLRGLGDVDGGVVLGAFAGYRLMPWLLFDVSYHRTVSGDVDGGQLRFGLEYEAPVSSKITLVGRLGATYADENYMAAYFGVTNAQSANSLAGLGTYDANSGIKDVHLELGARVLIDDRWAMKVGARYGRLVGDAADSPVIETEDQFSGFANITYRFGSIN